MQIPERNPCAIRHSNDNKYGGGASLAPVRIVSITAGSAGDVGELGGYGSRDMDA